MNGSHVRSAEAVGPEMDRAAPQRLRRRQYFVIEALCQQGPGHRAAPSWPSPSGRLPAPIPAPAQAPG